MDVSCAFPTTLDTPEHVAVAEEIGYRRAWLYDTPQNSPDVWMSLALSAARTTRIGLGPGVLVPTLRHPMVNAAATATLAELAPGRVTVAFGTGFSGRRAMGYRGIGWSYMRGYIAAYLGLLRGETVEWEGARMRMLHPDGSAPPRPVDVPVLIAAQGPKGRGVAEEFGAGLFASRRLPDFASAFSRVALLAFGTVLDDGEDASSPRVRAAAGPGAALFWHSTYEFGGPDAVRALPGGPEWMRVVEREAPELRHLAVHRGHAVELNDADAAAWAAGGEGVAGMSACYGTPDRIRARLAELRESGLTEIVYQPGGPDIRAELERFHAVAATA